MKKIGMVGIGLMGHGIASNLQKHGHALGLFEHPGNQPLAGLKAGGARGFASAKELAAASDVVITVLTGSPQVEAVVLGPGGLLEGLRPGSVLIDCSTAVPSSTVRVAAAVQQAGARFLDAPMTRTPKEAAEGRLNLLVGGDAALLEECRPVLQCFAENITHAGPVGAGRRFRDQRDHAQRHVVVQQLHAVARAHRTGVRDVLGEALQHRPALLQQRGVALERMKPYLLAGDPTGLKFTIANARKDLDYYNAMASDAAAAKEIAAAVLSTLEGALAKADTNTFVPELVSILAAR